MPKSTGEAQEGPVEISPRRDDVIKVSILYPNPENCRFDFDYYCKSHLPMVKARLGNACQGIAVDKGIAGESGSPAPFVAAVHLFFESAEAFQRSFDPNAKEILADTPNYTNVQPNLMFSQVLVNATRSHTGELHVHKA